MCKDNTRDIQMDIYSADIACAADIYCTLYWTADKQTDALGRYQRGNVH